MTQIFGNSESAGAVPSSLPRRADVVVGVSIWAACPATMASAGSWAEPLATKAMAVTKVGLSTERKATSSAIISIRDETASWASLDVGSQGSAERQAAKAHSN